MLSLTPFRDIGGVAMPTVHSWIVWKKSGQGHAKAGRPEIQDLFLNTYVNYFELPFNDFVDKIHFSPHNFYNRNYK